MTPFTRLIHACALIAGLAVAGGAQDQQLDRLKHLPEAARVAAVAELGDDAVGTVARRRHDGATAWQVEITAPHRRRVLLTEAGVVISRERELTLAQAPAAVRATIERERAADRLTGIVSLESTIFAVGGAPTGTETRYQARIVGRDGTRVACVDAAGKTVRQP